MKSPDLFYMVFFIDKGKASRSEPVDSYYAAIEEAKKGPSGAMFQISRFVGDDNMLVTTGFVE
jgi:hypothetical protein